MGALSRGVQPEIVNVQPDQALIRRFLAGEELAFRQLYERHTPRLRMTLLRLVAGVDHDADDLVQDTWLSACRGMRSFRGDALFSTWLTSIGVRAALAHLGRRIGTETEFLEEVSTEIEPALTASLDVDRALGRLSDRQRIVVVLHDIEGFTHEEIAGQLGIAVGTSKVTLFRARAVLRVALGLGEHNVSRA